MRSLDRRRVDFWTPDVPPTVPDDLPGWLSIQLKNLANTIFNVNMLHVERTYKWSDRYKPREGDIVLAAEGLIAVDSAAGLYYYDGTNWKILDA